MDLAYLIANPNKLNQETLYDLRRLVAVYPTFHAARILFLKNLFLLHDPLFDQELRRAALLVPDRRVLFDLTHSMTKLAQGNAKATKKPQPVEHPDSDTPQQAAAEQPTKNSAENDKKACPKPQEVAHEQETTPAQTVANQHTPQGNQPKAPRKKYATGDTTARLLDNFLDTTPAPLAKKRIKADPSTDYMAYLLQQDEKAEEMTPTANRSRMDDLIDSFLATSDEGISLSDDPMIPEVFRDDATEETTKEHETKPADEGYQKKPYEEDSYEDYEEDVEEEDGYEDEDYDDTDEEEDEIDDDEDDVEESPNTHTTPITKTQAYEAALPSSELTEQLAQIYIKQGKYERAIEILNKISASDSTSRNPYLADQMRFLQKLASLNAKNNKSK